MESAKKILNKCIKAFNRPPMDSSIEKYYKGGYMATLEFYHYDELSWAEIVVEVIDFGQRVGSGWSILGGSINTESNAVLSKNIGNHISISGQQWAEWQVFNEPKAN